jgi:hypothetical protein
MELRSTFWEARFRSWRPTGVDPVKETFLTRGSRRTASLKAPDFEVVMTWIRSSGTPASMAS